MSDPRASAPEPSTGSHYQPALGVVLVIVVLFVAATFVMVRAVSPSTPGTTTTSTTLAHHGTTPPSHAVVRSAVRVQVANGTLTTNLAGTFTQRLITLGWNALPAENAPRVTATVIYFKPGFAKAAREVASEIHVSSSVVRPLGHLNPVTGTTTGEVIVVLGPNSAVG